MQAQPYSKSHLKREKKKARQQLAGGMGSVAAALVEVAPELAPEVAEPATKPSAKDEEERRRDDGRIGAGTKRTMGEKQRRRQM